MDELFEGSPQPVHESAPEETSSSPPPLSLSPQPASTAAVSNIFQLPPLTDDSPLMEYQRQHEERLLEKSKTSGVAEQAMLEKAQSDIDAFYAEVARKKEIKEKSNREAEEQFLEADKGLFAHGTVWEQVSKCVSFKKTEGGKDVSRLRGLLIDLKQKPVLVPQAETV